jgi:hypothetical protein
VVSGEQNRPWPWKGYAGSGNLPTVYLCLWVGFSCSGLVTQVFLFFFAGSGADDSMWNCSCSSRELNAFLLKNFYGKEEWGEKENKRKSQEWFFFTLRFDWTVPKIFYLLTCEKIVNVIYILCYYRVWSLNQHTSRNIKIFSSLFCRTSIYF